MVAEGESYCTDLVGVRLLVARRLTVFPDRRVASDAVLRYVIVS